MKYLNWNEYEDIIDRFRWYPKPFRLTIFCRDKETLNIFQKEFEKLDIKWIEKKIQERRFILIKEFNQIIEVVVFCKNSRFYGSRANAIFYDTNFPIKDVYESILPIANLCPLYDCYGYDKQTLIEMFEKKNCICSIEGERYVFDPNKEEERANENK